MTAQAAERRREIERGFIVGLGRAFGGSIVFVLPVLMTMEMWELGASIERWRLALLLLAVVPMLVGLSHYIGFEETEDWMDDVRDAFVALFVGFVTSTVVLALFGLMGPTQSFDEILGAIVIQTVPASFGAVIAQGQLGQSDEEDERRNRKPDYAGDLLFLASGAVFLSFNIAPTEEVDLIAASMTPYHAVALALLSITVMHAIVYGVRFSGSQALAPGERQGALGVFLAYTLAGYAISLGVSAAMLWLLGRLDGLGGPAGLRLVVTLGFPAAVGAAFARLIVGGQSE
ncbi:TIGR02587 family membrane protein [Hansschlegelia quercus]|uniref:TIGR02587 family membrane protein n=1 Tax=Hansschlegelia quercus TaxID=2528245 RepID=A0A4Q9GKI1_9HYPH|nr:TIGR02587 family membrane protein [Hansschlegelia quercus]TBN54708.1 TIGR02587 family membrane protein [Hansschlegelia quercus]